MNMAVPYLSACVYKYKVFDFQEKNQPNLIKQN